MKNLLLFTADIPAHRITAVDMPGFSHWADSRPRDNQPMKTVYFFAPNRSDAARQLNAIGQNTPCNLTDGRRADTLIAAQHRRAFGL
jgi:hypothetical protein